MDENKTDAPEEPKGMKKFADIPEDKLYLFEKRIPKPHYVRVNDYKRMYGANYIIRRNEFGSAMCVLGKSYRKLSTDIDVEIALKMGKLVAQWGNKFFLYTRVDVEAGRMILDEIWEMEVKRGIPVPEASDYDKADFYI
ncbi:MAG: hypothetical protein P9L92_12180 [Candidatus Electryonea clarkiae]|nr:hypothetical protein [Candidatus Electryonea clarkiae]MDP8289103.1 hypothetical protein [Candidatus Electryonea clarkiae]